MHYSIPKLSDLSRSASYEGFDSTTLKHSLLAQPTNTTVGVLTRIFLVNREIRGSVSTVVQSRTGAKSSDPPLLDVSGAARHLGCSDRFIRRLVQERRIPFVKLAGTKVRFLPRDLDRWVESQIVESRH
jgi:excisionase family DNA binding protein